MCKGVKEVYNVIVNKNHNNNYQNISNLFKSCY